MEIRKEQSGAQPGQVEQRDLEEINALSKGELKAEDVYVFSLRLCDNEVDRDFQRFDREALERLGELFVGKSGLFDHQWSAEGQTARIYRTEVCREAGAVTVAGDDLYYLKGWAYMLRSDKNADLIAEIEAGIKKEVSVGCSVAECVCSICGSTASCEHVPGRSYGGKLCYQELRHPTDAYEWSFVAVPAQREAGVLRKRWGVNGEKRLNGAQWEKLRREAELGRRYLKELRSEVVRLAMLSDDTLDGALFGGIADKLEEPELLELRRVYRRRAKARFCPEPQLRSAAAAGKQNGDEGAFLV